MTMRTACVQSAAAATLAGCVVLTCLSQTLAQPPALQPREVTVEQQEAEFLQAVAEAQAVVDQTLDPSIPLVDGPMLQPRLVDGYLAIDRLADGTILTQLPGGLAKISSFGRRRGDFRSFQANQPVVGEHEAIRNGDQPMLSIALLFVGPDASDSIRFSRDAEYLDGGVTVELAQPSVAMLMDDAPPVTLRVRGSGERTIDISLEAQSVSDLRRRHRETFDRWAMPLLGDFGLAEVMRNEIRETARSVFLSELMVEPAMEVRVEELLAALDAKAFETRSAAETKLRDLGLPAATVMYRRADDMTLSLEVQTRLQELLIPYLVVAPEEAERLRQDEAFLREVLLLDDEPNDSVLRELARRQLDSTAS
jgi:hypothetical protein